jgi:enoyl-CoA hydratase
MTLRAPERRNALSVEMADAMVEACEQIDADPAIGAVVVTGDGLFFCAGGDRAQLAAAGKDPAEPELYRAMGRI